MSNDALEVVNVSLQYNGEFHALREVSFSISEGEFVALLGPSGCGKSSLLGAIAGFLRPSHGLISVSGKQVVGPGSDRGIVFQHHTLFPWKSALENVVYPMKCRGLNPSVARQQARSWIIEVGLEGFEHFYPGELSGGMQQRVALARLFMTDPRIFLLDEPFGALDAYTKLQMQELLLRIWERHQRTVLFVTHDIEEALLLADRVLIMSSAPGTIVEQFAVPLRRPRTPAALFTPEVVAIRQHVLSLMQQEHRKKTLFNRRNPKRIESTRSLRVGYVSDIAALPLLVASKKRADIGLKCDLLMEPNGDVIIEEVSSGQLDIGEVSLVSAVLGAWRSKRFRIISGWGTFNAFSSDLMAICGPKPSSDRTLKPFLDKRLGLNGFGTLTEFLVRRAFQDLGQIPQLVSLRPESFRFAMEQRVVEAVAAMDPWLGSLRDAPDFEVVRSLDAYLPPDPLFVLVASEEALQSRERDIADFLNVCQAGWARVESDVDLRIELIAEFLGVRPSKFVKPFTLRKYETVDLENVEAVKDSLSEVGMLKETAQFECSQLLRLLR